MVKNNNIQRGRGYVLVNPPAGQSSGGGGGTWGSIIGTITDQTDLVTYIDTELAGIADVPFAQPSASTSWVIVHGRVVKTNFAFFNAANEREYPIEDHSVVGQVSVTFATSEVHTAVLVGNGASASLRGDTVVTLLASAINTASGVIDITTAKTIIIDMDVDLAQKLTFIGTPSEGYPLILRFKKGATPYAAFAAEPLDITKFKGSPTNALPSPLLTATANTTDTFQFLNLADVAKMSLIGSDLGA